MPGLVLAALSTLIAPQAIGQSYPFCKVCTNTESVTVRFSPPAGYKRVDALPGSYAEWLRSMPLLPPNADALDWTARSALPSDTIAGVLDWHLLGQVEQCADIAIRLTAEYARTEREDDRIAFRSLSGEAIKWTAWKRGRYTLNDLGSAIVYHPGTKTQDSQGAFDDYLRFVMTYANTASLKRDWPIADSAKLRIGDVLIQPGCPGTGMGHLSVIVDACENASHEQLYLFIDGYTPARMPVVRQRVQGERESAWMTPAQYQQSQIQFGWGMFHRFPGWERAASQ